MTIEKALQMRSESKCELCREKENLEVYQVPPYSDGSIDHCILICGTCCDQLLHPEKINPHHWRCLTDSMWSQTPAVQVMAWRMLTSLNTEGWAQDSLAMLYLDEATQAWAQSSGDGNRSDDAVKHLDSNGTPLSAGDTVTLIKDLTVKGANFTAKRGTIVRGISLVDDNPEHIEARVGGQQIVILTKFTKKAN